MITTELVKFCKLTVEKKLWSKQKKKKRVIKPYNLVTKIFRLVDSWLQ